MLPSYLSSGEVARLFPVIAETGKEQRATSILLSVFSMVPEFSKRVLTRIGQAVGTRTSVVAYTEIVFKSEDRAVKGDRPDGLLVLKSGKKTWSALLEVKIGRNELRTEQIERYLRLARDHDIDCVMTISNDFAAVPEHTPYTVPKNLTKKVQLFHFSWMGILTDAVLMHDQAALSDPERAFLIREFVRFLSHPSAGLTGFTKMPHLWSDTVGKIQAGGQADKPEALEIVNGWHQEVRDLSLRLSRVVSCKVDVKLPRSHRLDRNVRSSDDIETLIRSNCLTTVFSIPDAAGDLSVVADLNSRVIRVSMTIAAPKDRKTTKARLNWVLRQINDVEKTDCFLGVIWSSRASKTTFLLTDLVTNPDQIRDSKSNAEIKAFELTMTTKNVRRFGGQRTFIEELETIVPKLYEDLGQHLVAWKPPPPKTKHSGKIGLDEDNLEVPDSPPTEKPPLVETDGSTEPMLEIPNFLKRFRPTL